ncbi:DUF3854 domain-containing protein [Fimbriiglobus ruber]|uniref:DNA primase domain protein n=1 Tax=Fimbriiglobus ruber TaxID=1908690 RepID=A0A225E7U9_9BACT|nr:DUF3854 domain-containing protein [Fimbriiglobus ruber]OWK45589.1 DNA primase domain protein [Fimbriiglobus ruber]
MFPGPNAKNPGISQHQRDFTQLVNWSGIRAKTLGPVLVFPHYNCLGQALNHAIIKPDRPRDRRDKPGKVKYENPRQRPNRVYIPAGARDALLAPTAVILITEGIKKALAATQNGFPCISLPGVWSWVAPREKTGGRRIEPYRLNADLECIEWKARRVVVIFDSDAVSNADVRRAERALTDALCRRGADVRIVRLPTKLDGGKNGIDDYLYDQGVNALRQLVADAPSFRQKINVEPTEFTESGYTVHQGSTYYCTLAKDDNTDEFIVAKKIKLANFFAKIVGESVTDDGIEQTREFTIEGQQWGKTARTVRIPFDRFLALDWVMERLGPQFVIQAGSGKRDHLRAAIQEMSDKDFLSATVCTYTGWRKINGQWCYLHAGGAVIPIVPGFSGVEVRLDGAASGFRLPPPPSGNLLHYAVRSSLGILSGLVRDSVAFPLLATTYRAALGNCDFALWLSGPTGVQKSELAALAQQHYGASMTRGQLPGNWSSTDNALEGLAFTVKDTVLVIDDFAPSASRADTDRQQRAAERLIRGQGNGAGRQRMRSDSTLRPSKPPRALVLATGEDVPSGQSINSRLSVVAMRNGDVALSRLSECQRDAIDGLFASAMAGFIAWLAPQYETVRTGLDAERIELRDRFVGRFPHTRTPDIIANQLIGLRYLIRFAEEIEAIEPSEGQNFWQRGESAFRAVADQQSENQRSADPVERFSEMLSTIVSSGRGHIAGRDGRKPVFPPSAEAWGWHQSELCNAQGKSDGNYQERGRKIGWVADTELYLDPDSTFAALTELAREQGQVFPITKQTLYGRLKEARILIRSEGDRTTYPVTLEGTRHRVLVLDSSTLLGKPGQSG